MGVLCLPTPALAAEPPTRGHGASFTYDAFLSYNHQDGAVAAGIQKGLHRIGRRVGQLNALRVFRDSTDLAANPDLWGKVTDAMDRSRYLIVVLSIHGGGLRVGRQGGRLLAGAARPGPTVDGAG